MKISVIILAAAVFLSSCASTQVYMKQQVDPGAEYLRETEGELVEVYQTALPTEEGSRRMLVYLPPGYDTTSRRYPVLYMLHGARGNETSWIVKGDILPRTDSLTKEKAMKQTIIVFPNMNQYDNESDRMTSREKGAIESFFGIDGTVESRFAEDVVGLTDSLFRTIPKKEYRAIAGLSLGGMQAIHISASHPEMFDYIGAFSPIVKVAFRNGADAGFYKKLKRRIRYQFADPPASYRLMTGRNDFLRPQIESFHCYLDEKDYPHDYYLSSGGHQWDNWMDYSTMFLKSLWSEDR